MSPSLTRVPGPMILIEPTSLAPEAPPTAPTASGAAPTISQPPPRPAARRRWLLFLVLTGLVARFALAALTWGTNDANTFGQFGFYITRDGLINTYLHDTYLNHPPMPSYWCAAAWRLTMPLESRWSPEVSDNRLYAEQITQDSPGRWFSAVFKLPALLADGASAWLLYLVWRRRIGTTGALAVSAGFAWSLCAILVTAYHCNTDSVYAFLCLLCVYLVQDKRRHFLGGFALAAAINVKLTPVLLIPPLLLSYRFRERRAAVKFLAGLGIGVLPFIPVLYFAGQAFYGNAIAYKSNPDRWGITYLLMQLGPHSTNSMGGFYPPGAHAADVFFNRGRPVVLGLIGLWALTAGLLRRWDLYEVAAVTLAIFLFVTPGFGVQYTVLVLPLMFAVRPQAANAYGLLAGLFLFVVYWAHWTGRGWPYSQFNGMLPWPSPLWGLAAWAALGYFLVRVVSHSLGKAYAVDAAGRAVEPLVGRASAGGSSEAEAVEPRAEARPT